MFIYHKPESDRKVRNKGHTETEEHGRRKDKKDSRIYSISLKLRLDQLRVKLVFNVLLKNKMLPITRRC